MAPTTRRRRLAVLALTILALLVVGVPPVAAADRPATPAQAEQRFVELLNQRRQGQGLPALAVDPGLIGDAQRWSGEMAARNQMVHASSSRLSGDTARSVAGWIRGGENIGKGWDVEGLDEAFWRSPTHRDNILGDFNRVGVGVVYTPSNLWVTVRFAKGPAPAPAPTYAGGDVWMADGRGQVFTSGSARHHGDASGLRLNQPVVAMDATASKAGYWLLGQDGGVFTYGDARFFGSTGGMRLNQPVNGMAATPSGGGYWLVASDGGIFAFGDARFFGSTGGMRLNQPVNGMAATPSGGGYWLVASDGGIFTYGDAPFVGSAADGRLGAPVVGIAATPSGRGYWLAASNGRVAAFGDARHFGDTGGNVTTPIARLQAAPDGRGYWLVARDGSMHAFGSVGSGVSAARTGGGVVAVASAR